MGQPWALGPYRDEGRFGGIDSVSSVRPATTPETLAAAPVGARLRVVAVDPAHADELVREGLLPGTVLEVASRTPLGGPVIVVLGRVRIALSAQVAAGVSTEPVA
jgi:Fe2+ transport system protein FeoA